MTVHLVGAGPGDPGLLTVRAAELLARAEVVVYDRPSMADIVALAPQSRTICVGKRGRVPALPQDEVNALLISLGGQEVVRLKAGDPFVVSRGGEEALALVAAGVDVRVVPGVSAATAAPALAGMPPMVRQLTTTLLVIAGNDDPEYPGTPDLAAAARLGGTIVVLTGRSAIRRIADGLLDGGLPEDTAVVAVSSASRPGQRVERGTLGGLPSGRLAPPVTYVIGATAGLDLFSGEDSAYS